MNSNSAFRPIASVLIALGLNVSVFTQAQQDSAASSFHRSLTAAPVEAGSSGGGAGGERPNPQQDLAALAKMLENPIAKLVQVPIQNNFDFGIGPANAMRYTLNVQPVIPFTLSEDWNLITRTIVPFIYAEKTGTGDPEDKDRAGLSDITQSFFFSPVKPVGGWILGAGPVLRYPSATDSFLGGEKWGAGPTAVALQQNAGWTYGGLVNHLWDYAGESSRGRLNQTFIQPFVARGIGPGATVALSSEMLYDWPSGQWTVPVNLTFAKMFRFGKQPVRIAVGGRVYAERPPGGPDWGLRFQLIFPFPR